MISRKYSSDVPLMAGQGIPRISQVVKQMVKQLTLRSRYCESRFMGFTSRAKEQLGNIRDMFIVF